MFCPNCGKQIPDGSMFCPECGGKLGGAAVAPDAGLKMSRSLQAAAPLTGNRPAASAPQEAFRPAAPTQQATPAPQGAPVPPTDFRRTAPTSVPPAAYAPHTAYRPVKTKKGLSKGGLIAIIAAAVAVIAAAVVLIIVLNSPKHKLVGSWVYKYEGEEAMRITFKKDGKGTLDLSYGSADIKWSVGKNNKLKITLINVDGDEVKWALKYDKDEAKEEQDLDEIWDDPEEDSDGFVDAGYWYTDGKTLYLFGQKLTKDSSKKDSDQPAASPENALKGSWTQKNGDFKVTMTFKGGGKGEIKTVYDGEEGSSTKFKWKVGSKNKLTITFLDDDGDEIYELLLKYDKKFAKDPDEADEDDLGDDYDGFWYIDGKTLYINGEEYKKK